MDKAISRKLKQYINMHGDGYVLDDITFNDLNMDDVFEKIDDTSSSLGQEILYGMLRKPLTDRDLIDNRMDIISYYENHEDEVRVITKILEDTPKLKSISIFEYLEKLNEAPSLSVFILFRAIILTVLAIIIFFINVPIGVISIVFVYFFNAINYFKYRNKILPYFTCVSYITKTVSLGVKLPFINSEKYKDIQFLKRGAYLLGNISGETVNGGNGNPLDIFLNLIKMGLYVDLIKFNSLTTKVKNNKDKIFEFLEEIGTIDACICIANLRKNRDNVCIPKFGEEKRIHIVEAVHPLIDNPVSNTIDTSKSILLTGSNASGKSTFLRMVGINVVLAQSICTAFAKEYTSGIFNVISSMSLTDSVNRGDSFYMAEIKSIKRIIDSSDSLDNILCFLDEVLKGTNTKERIAGASSILKFLADRTICFAATHDLELTDILIKQYDNYHFSEDVNEGDICFSYLLKKGASNTTNAIKLLEKLEFPKEVIENAYSLNL